MEKFKKEKIETLSDVFAAWIGGYPETTYESKSFLKQNGLDKLLTFEDLETLLHYNGYLKAEAVPAVYAKLPLELELNKKKFVLFAQTFNRLNVRAAQSRYGRLINSSPLIAQQIVVSQGEEKSSYIKKNINRLRRQNYKLTHPNAQKEAYKRRREQMSEEELAKHRETSRLRMQRYRAEHPEKIVAQNKKSKEKMTPLQETLFRIASRRRNKKYRETNKEKISQKSKAAREKMKAENPELLKAKEKAYNSSDKHKKNCKTYYERHKDEINQKARENPKTAVYKRRYKIKKRLEKTGPKLMSMLAGLLQKKEGR